LANFLRTEAKRIGSESVAEKYVYITAGAGERSGGGSDRSPAPMSKRSVLPTREIYCTIHQDFRKRIGRHLATPIAFSILVPL
jgi:hypothetical protein